MTKTDMQFLAVLAFLPVSIVLAQPSISYGTGAWSPEVFGNHRAVVRVNSRADAVWVHLEWRRRDRDPANKQIVIVDAATGKPVANLSRVNINRDSGDLIFQPVSGPGEYQVYFLPYITTGRANYPKVAYPPPSVTADPDWLREHHAETPQEAGAHRAEFPIAEVLAFQSVDDFDRFTSMEVIATQAEVAALLGQHPRSDYLIFPEDRRNSIRMTSDLPSLWVQRGPGAPLVGTAARGEFYSFQLGVWAARNPLTNLRVQFGDLRDKAIKQVIPAS
ncbi:MAG: glycoside hydrolase domain-containing protein, partial [Bryobacteraceae bacterium]